MARTHFSGPVVTSNYGTVTQATNKQTTVVSPFAAGTITMNGEALAAAAETGFTVTCNKIKATDVPVVAIKSGGTAHAYTVEVSAVADGSFVISVGNVSAGSLSEALVLNYVIVGANV